VPEVHPLRHEALALACRTVPPGDYEPTVAGAAHALLHDGAGEADVNWSERQAELAGALATMSLAALAEDRSAPIVGGSTSPDDLAADAARALRRQAAFAPTVAERHRLLDRAARVRPWRWWG
jgi:hypothetical protein